MGSEAQPGKIRAPMGKKKPFVMERWGKLHETDRSFDIEYWQRQGPEAILEAAWEMVVAYEERKGRTRDQLRMRKDVERFGKISELKKSSET